MEIISNALADNNEELDGSTKVDLASQLKQKKINIIANFSKQLTQDALTGGEKKHVATNGIPKLDGYTKVDLASHLKQKKTNIIGNFSKQLTIMEKEHFDDDKILHTPIEIEHTQEAQSDILHTEELAKKQVQVDEAAKVGEQVENVDALNEHVIGYHNTEEESVTKIKHVPPNI